MKKRLTLLVGAIILICSGVLAQGQYKDVRQTVVFLINRTVVW